jgi:hypothetical protein
LILWVGCPVSYPLDHEALISEIISYVPDMFDLREKLFKILSSTFSFQMGLELLNTPILEPGCPVSYPPDHKVLV